MTPHKKLHDLLKNIMFFWFFELWKIIEKAFLQFSNLIFEHDKTSENIKYQPLNKDDISNHTHKQKNRTNRSANDAKTNDKDQKRNNFLLPNNSLVVSACFNTQITTETQYVVAHNYPAHPRRLNGIVPLDRRTMRLLQKSIWKQLADTPSSTAAYSNASKNCSDFLLSLFSLSKKKLYLSPFSLLLFLMLLYSDALCTTI